MSKSDETHADLITTPKTPFTKPHWPRRGAHKDQKDQKHKMRSRAAQKTNTNTNEERREGEHKNREKQRTRTNKRCKVQPHASRAVRRTEERSTAPKPKP